MLNINLKQLEVFVCVAQCSSFSVAAETLYLAQSTVSSHVAALEEALGVALLERGSRKKVVLTKEGNRVYLYSKDILHSCRELQAEFADHVEELLIGASTIPMAYLLPELMTEFQKACPECRYVLKKGDSADVHRMLDSGQVQIGFVGSVFEPEKLVYQRIYEDKLVLVTPAAGRYRQLQKQGTLGRELLTEPLIVRSNGSGTRQAVDHYLSESGISPERINIIARIESNEAILQSVSQGLGNAVLSALAAEHWMKKDKLLVFELEEKPVTRPIYMVYQKCIRPGNVMDRFIEFVRRFHPLSE